MSKSGSVLVLAEVAIERVRQERLCEKGKFPWTCAATYRGMGPSIDPGEPANFDAAKLAVLAEEFGEVAKLVTESLIDFKRRGPSQLREELIQVAAVAVAWAEALDAESKDDE